MKKLFLISIMLILAAGLIAGCAAPAPAPAPSPAPAPAPAPAPTAAPAPAPATTPTKPMELKFAHYMPLMSLQVATVFTPWAQAVEKAANGRLKITQYPSEQLAKQADIYDAIATGLADIGIVTPEATPGRFPLAGISVLPGLLPDAIVGAQVYQELLDKYCVGTEFKDVKPLMAASYQTMQIFSNKPIQKVEDMKGMKWRTEGRIEEWVVQALGATGVELGLADAYNALDRKLIDGCFLQWSAGTSFGIYNVTKNRTQVDLFSRAFPIVMNLKVWNNLPADIKKAFADNSNAQASALFNGAFGKANDSKLQVIIDADKKAGKPDVIYLTADERAKWIQAVMPVRDKWVAEMQAKGLPGKAMLDDAIALVNKYLQAK